MSRTLKYKLLLFFSLVGLGISLYLAYVYIFSLPLPCGSNGCEVVRYSKYSHIFSVPVPVFGVIFYLTVLSASIAGILNKIKKIDQIVVSLTAIGFGFSLYFTFLELFVIKAICNWCVASAITATILLGISWMKGTINTL
jgi:uncharacterized membrane protein